MHLSAGHAYKRIRAYAMILFDGLPLVP